VIGRIAPGITIMRLIFLPVVLIAAFASSCAVQPQQETGATNTISGNRHLPSEEIAQFVPPSDWQDIRNREIVRYVIFGAKIRSDGSLTEGKVQEAYPDAAWNETARAFGKNVTLRIDAGSAAASNPHAEIYCIFFKPTDDGQDNYVLIYAQTSVPEVPASARPKFFQMKRY
jgi:hypothetical protein